MDHNTAENTVKGKKRGGVLKEKKNKKGNLTSDLANALLLNWLDSYLHSLFPFLGMKIE